MNKFNCECKYRFFDLIYTKNNSDYYLCSCDKIYKLTDGQKWEFVNYDSCAYCLKPKDICLVPDIECKKAPDQDLK